MNVTPKEAARVRMRTLRMKLWRHKKGQGDDNDDDDNDDGGGGRSRTMGVYFQNCAATEHRRSSQGSLNKTGSHVCTLTDLLPG